MKIKMINIIFKIISIFFPVKKRVLFISNHKDKLLENSQILYDNLDCEKKVCAYNLPRSKQELIKISYYIMTSKVIIIDDYSYYFVFIPLKEQQKLIQLWHSCGDGMKKMGLDAPHPHPYEKFSHEQCDNFIICSDEGAKIYTSAFNLKKEVLTKVGYPRIDLLIHNQKEYEKEFYDKYPNFINKKIILFAPTVRDTNGYSNIDFDFEINWEDLDDFLGKNNFVFLIKRHPTAIDNNLKIIKKEYTNIIDIGDVSNYPLLAASDLLVTDYSGIYIDYLLFSKPIIFYGPDLEDYLKIFDPYCKIPDDLPGTFCQNYEELINAISTQHETVDYLYHIEKRLKYCDGNSTNKLLKIIDGYLDK